MKTEVILNRALENGSIRQSSKTGYFSLTDLIQTYTDTTGETKQLHNYLGSIPTRKFMQALAQDQGVLVNELLVTRRGRYNGGTWAHPYIFVDLAMWLSPEFKVVAIGWIYDNLVKFRNSSGDSFSTMNSMLDRAYNIGRQYWIYPKVANLVASAVGLESCAKDRWQHATEEQLKLRDELQAQIIRFAYGKLGVDPVDCAKRAIREYFDIQKMLKD